MVSALVFAVLAVATLVLLRGRTPREPTPLFSLQRRVPDTLVVVSPPDTSVLVPGGTSGWRLVRPVEDAADGLVVEAMLKRLRPLKVLRRLPFEEKKLDTYGLRYPRGMIRAVYGSGLEPDTLVIGASTLNGGKDYVRAGTQGEVGLVDSRLPASFLIRSTLDFRDTRLLPFPESEARGLTIRDAVQGTLTRLVREPEGRWRVLDPYPGPASGEKVRNFLGALSHMKIDLFAAERITDAPAVGLAPPRLSVTVLLERGDTLTAALGIPVPGREWVFARTAGKPQLLGVSKKYPAVLRRGADPLRDPVVLPFGLRDVDSLLAIAGSGRRRSWKAEAWRGVDHRETPLRGVLENWIKIRSGAFAPAGRRELHRYHLGPKSDRLVWFGRGDTLLVVEKGRETGGRIPVRTLAGRKARPGEVLFLPADPGEVLWSFLLTGTLEGG